MYSLCSQFLGSVLQPLRPPPQLSRPRRCALQTFVLGRRTLPAAGDDQTSRRQPPLDRPPPIHPHLGRIGRPGDVCFPDGRNWHAGPGRAAEDPAWSSRGRGLADWFFGVEVVNVFDVVSPARGGRFLSGCYNDPFLLAGVVYLLLLWLCGPAAVLLEGVGRRRTWDV